MKRWTGCSNLIKRLYHPIGSVDLIPEPEDSEYLCSFPRKRWSTMEIYTIEISLPLIKISRSLIIYGVLITSSLSPFTLITSSSQLLCQSLYEINDMGWPESEIQDGTIVIWEYSVAGNKIFLLLELSSVQQFLYLSIHTNIHTLLCICSKCMRVRIMFILPVILFIRPKPHFKTLHLVCQVSSLTIVVHSLI